MVAVNTRHRKPLGFRVSGSAISATHGQTPASISLPACLPVWLPAHMEPADGNRIAVTCFSASHLLAVRCVILKTLQPLHQRIECTAKSKLHNLRMLHASQAVLHTHVCLQRLGTLQTALRTRHEPHTCLGTSAGTTTSMDCHGYIYIRDS